MNARSYDLLEIYDVESTGKIVSGSFVFVALHIYELISYFLRLLHA